MINFTSIIGLDAKTFFSICVSVDAPPTDAKYLMAYLALTVFPAPLSPLTMIDWFSPSLNYKKKKVLQFYCTSVYLCLSHNGTLLIINCGDLQLNGAINHIKQ